MEIRFDDKRALVTGAGQGLGRAIAKALVEGGAKTFALSRTKAHLDSLKLEVLGIHIVVVDLSDWASTRAAVEALGPIDLLVNNAGIAGNSPCLETPEEDIDRMMNVNAKAAINISQVVAKGMVERKTGGAIVNVSSQATMMAVHGFLAYATSKAAMEMASKIMALELGPHQIRVNCVNPTVVMTAMGRKLWSDPEKAAPMLARIPQGKFAEEKDVVHAVLYLLSDKADMINGASLPVDGGASAT